ncbi:MAG: hypothetical protein HKN68_20620 [Saprospiraceae bacterium]|nr:hypothetical protein [Saprospiraceae bacterium]
MNKYLQSILLLAIILFFKAVPFLYNDTYAVKDMKCGWIIGFPLALLIRNIYKGVKEEKE